jgi:nucleoside-diphosphate kinase
MEKEETMVLIKPDAIEKKLIGKIITRLETEGFDIVDMIMLDLDRKDAETLYGVHKGKDFFERNIAFVISGPVIAMILEGDNVIERVRTVMGSTSNPGAGTIRAEFGVYNERTLMHASDSPEAAAFEIGVIDNALLEKED